MPQHPMRAAERYIARIRNANKKRYAAAYDAYIVRGQTGPEPRSADLSVMGAQAVRLELADIYDGWHHNGARLVRDAAPCP